MIAPPERTLRKGRTSRPAEQIVSVLFLLSDLTAFPQQTGKQRAAPATPTHHPTSREEAHQLALSALAAVVIVILVVVIVLVPALAHEMGCAAEAAAAQYATGDQETQYPAMITFTVLVVVILVAAFLVFVVLLMPVTH